MCCSGAGGCSDSSGRLAAMASVTHASSHTPNASARYLHYPEQRFSCFHSPLTCVSELPTHLLRVKRATSWCALAYHCGVVLARLLSFCTRIVGFTVCGWPSSWALSLQAAPDRRHVKQFEQQASSSLNSIRSSGADCYSVAAVERLVGPQADSSWLDLWPVSSPGLCAYGPVFHLA